MPFEMIHSHSQIHSTETRAGCQAWIEDNWGRKGRTESRETTETERAGEQERGRRGGRFLIKLQKVLEPETGVEAAFH